MRTAGIFRIPRVILSLAVVSGFILISIGVYRAGSSVQEILWENKALRMAITNLSHADKIGYAKVISQKRDSQGFVIDTTLKFVETAADDQMQKVLEKQFTIAGDIVHFDALIVKFDNRIVMDGQKKSMYLWRRVYGENTSPAEGITIEPEGATPARYANILKELPLNQQKDFWQAIWDLTDDPDKLKDKGIEAVYGNVTYTRLSPGMLYIFKINATGQIYPEILPEF